MPSSHPLKILVIQGLLVPEQLSVFRACARLGLEIKVIGYSGPFSGPYRGKWWSDPGDDDALVERLTPVRLRGNNVGWLYRGLRARVREFGPAILHVNSEPWGLLVEQALWTGRPVIAHGCENQSYTHGSRGEALLRKTLARRNLPRLAGFGSWNQAGIALALQNGLPSDAPLLVAPSDQSDPEPFLAAARDRQAHRNRFAMKAGCFCIGFVGRLDPPKGLQYLIDALALLEQDNLELVVAGEGSARRQLEDRAQSAGIRARFLGLLPMSDIPALMASVDAMVVPSVTTPGWAEQFGRVVVESMFAGTPLVVTNSGSMPEVVDGAAIIVPERAPGPLADAVERLRREPEFSRQLAQRARDQALKRFHPDRLAEQFIEFWSRVASRARS